MEAVDIWPKDKPFPAYVKRGGGEEYMPVELKGILIKHGLSQSDLGKALVQTGGTQKGRSFSSATVSQLLNWDIWPVSTSRDDIIAQATEWLKGKGVSKKEIAIAWDFLDPDQEHNPNRPKEWIHGPSHAERKKRAAAKNPIVDLPENEMLSEAARRHFKLFRDPFNDDVQGPDDVFLSHEQRYIRESMYQAAKHSGFLAVVGESGAGKTTLRRDLIDRIQRQGDNITIIQPRIIDKGGLTAAHICDAIISDISTQNAKKSLEAKARQIETLMVGSSRSGNAHVLMIEEAHDLSIKTLKYLKRFWEMEDAFRKLLGIILVGQPELKDKLDESKNWEAREVIRRIEVAELLPLNGDLEKYLALKFERLDRPLDDIFTPDAFDEIRQRLTVRKRNSDQTVCMHYPLVVNMAVTKALNLAAKIGEPKVNAEVVKAI